MLKGWIKSLLNLVYPPLCPLCRRHLTGDPVLCPTCLQALPGEAVFCPYCGGVHYPPSACLAQTYGFKGVIALGPYEGKMLEAVRKFKYGGVRRMAVPMAMLIRDRYLLAGWPRPSAVIPVPLHPRRERIRGYNQAGLLAAEISGLFQVPLVDALNRVKDTCSQTGLSAGRRRRNLQGAFIKRNRTFLPAGPLLLVDDVLTTGATVSQALQALNQGDNKEVYVAVAAQAVVLRQNPV